MCGKCGAGKKLDSSKAIHPDSMQALGAGMSLTCFARELNLQACPGDTGHAEGSRRRL
jgi:hypothetical protein